ncbi:UDP-N-acetylmuramate--L-alanine ligase [Pedobacter sp. MC2016-05]|uniref:UDP-N-acetylmuramate--L-alanine ligase n=1 Tax=Pedobacter sp. MC2016-05 TaxID=2994474 RepID=UPI002247AD3B|nr:UDP-N-acetylmuramate--L-alanine ligase [Pedobacter sp. MC2016-05]MCX2473952.1 UDP-N-acetylmuramate--L-alanine ligase [Pedobacter sp. MC2016-05]
MELSKINRVFFVGIGGIGMSALARYFAKRGQVVCGYDKTKTKLTETLEQEGILITYLDESASLPCAFLDHHDDTLVVYTPAIPKDSKILNHFIDKGFSLKKRSEVLGIISKGMFCIGIAGTHGKTTTSSIVAHILKDTGYDCTAFLGGITSNYNSNVLFGKNNVVVVEADEYDRSFLTLNPDIAVVTSMDADHLDIFGDKSHLDESFQLYAGQLKPNGTLYAYEGLPLNNSISYAASTTATAKAVNLRVEGSKFVFDYMDNGIQIKDISLMLPGRHNVENTTVAIAIALKLGIDADKIKQAVANFKGVKRRFEYIVNNDSQIYIDDYAHHPEELRACFDAVRQLYPDKKLTVIFQPHLFTRTRDFADDFAKVLSTADDLLLLEIYPARELPLEGIDSKFLLNKINLKNKQICGKYSVVQYVKDTKPELILTVGAGDIDTIIEPLKNALNHA